MGFFFGLPIYFFFGHTPFLVKRNSQRSGGGQNVTQADHRRLRRDTGSGAYHYIVNCRERETESKQTKVWRHARVVTAAPLSRPLPFSWLSCHLLPQPPSRKSMSLGRPPSATTARASAARRCVHPPAPCVFFLFHSATRSFLPRCIFVVLSPRIASRISTSGRIFPRSGSAASQTRQGRIATAYPTKQRSRLDKPNQARERYTPASRGGGVSTASVDARTQSFFPYQTLARTRSRTRTCLTFTLPLPFTPPKHPKRFI